MEKNTIQHSTIRRKNSQPEFDSAPVAADGGFELARCLVVEDVLVDVNDLGVLPVLMYGLVGFDEITGFA